MNEIVEKYKNLLSKSSDFNLNIKNGCLYLVSTPIGNLEDISFRALFILENSDLIACEDTRITGQLLKHYGIQNRLISYYSSVEANKSEIIIKRILSGETVALVSDSGTPLISDPGSRLIKDCIDNNIEVIPIPGASALIHSLVLSGFNADSFLFYGFLPHKGREKVFNNLKKYRVPLVFFESKFRVKNTIKDIFKHFGNVEISISRELTKYFEEHIRAKVYNIIGENFKIKEKGEFTIIVDNGKK